MLTITKLSKNVEGRWQSETLESFPKLVGEDSVLWVDVIDPTGTDIYRLIKSFDLGALDFSDIIDDEAESEIEEYERFLICKIILPKRESFISEGELERLSILMGKKWIITIHNEASSIVNAVYKKIKTHGYFSLSLTPSSDILLYIFLDLAVNEFFLTSDLEHQELQNLTMKAGALFRERPRGQQTSFRFEIAKSRNQVLGMSQGIYPLREIVGKITRGEFALISRTTISRFEDLHDRIISLHEVLDTHREEISDIGNILVNVQTYNTNNVIRVLTIVSVVFLPLALIAEIYGTNFSQGFFMPGSDSILGFYFMIIAMTCIAVALVLIFKKRGWL